MWKKLKLNHETWKWAVRRRHCPGSPLCVLSKGALSKGQPHAMEMGISQHDNPMQMSCRTSHVQQMDHDSENPPGLRTEISAMNIIQVVVGEKKKIKMSSVKEINRIEAPGLSWAHGELTLTLLCCCPQQFFLDEETLSILNTGMKTSVSCSHHGEHRKKDSFFCKWHSARVRKFTFCSEYSLEQT